MFLGLDISCKSSPNKIIHMKCQALENKKKKNKLIICSVHDEYTYIPVRVNITKTHLFKYIENFTTKNGKNSR